ncbi:hypothetical protein HDU83_000824, partial [Entophlyctis luteolus]
MAVKIEFIREYIEHKKLIVEHVISEENKADIFTKILGRSKFEKGIQMLGMKYL